MSSERRDATTLPAPNNVADKAATLREHFDRYGPFKFVIETGIWNGYGSCEQFQPEAEVVAIELDDERAQLGRARGLDVRTGDSAAILPTLLASRNAPALFWLDAHLVAEAHEINHSPLLDELAAIRDWPHASGSVVLIDDVRMMGRPGWPSAKQVIDYIAQRCPWWDRELRDDIFRAVPRR